MNGLGAAAALLLVDGRNLALGTVLGVLAYVAVVWRGHLRRPLHMCVRALLVVGIVAVSLARVGQPWVTLVAGVIMLLLVLHENTVGRLPKPGDKAVNLPGIANGHHQPIAVATMYRLNLLLVLWLAVCCWLRWHPVLVLVAAGMTALFIAARYIQAIIAWQRRPDELENLREALEAYGPEFVLHFSGKASEIHQITMWLPYLDRVGRRYAIFVRERHTLNQLAEITGDIPVVLCSTLATLEASVVDSLRVAFYVNNGMKNTHLVRFSQLTHVQLLHGDSDKPPSYSPVTALYDKVFVAGQAGRDRYTKHDVAIPDEKFVIVGRPQVEDITTTTEGGTPGRKTVLYGPTWRGQYEDSNFCSLPNAPDLMRALVRADVRVIMRPHPASAADPQSVASIEEANRILAEDNAANGTGHLFGPEAAELTLVVSFNMADALVSDVSSVASDFLFSGKPFAVSDMLDEGESFEETFPLSRCAYVIPRSMDGIDTILATMLDADPLAPEREAMRVYYLGDIDRAHYVDAFVTAAEAVIAGPQRKATMHEDNDDDEETGMERRSRRVALDESEDTEGNEDS